MRYIYIYIYTHTSVFIHNINHTTTNRYASLNPYVLANQTGQVLVRKQGALAGEQVTLESLEDCEVYACDTTAQVFVDFCKRSLILLGPCESSVFVRDCEDCVFYMAAQQLRTNKCKRCTFYLYSKTEPVIEESEELTFAPWAASYPNCAEQFKRSGFDPAVIRERGSAPSTGRHSTIFFSTKCIGAVAAWRF